MDYSSDTQIKNPNPQGKGCVPVLQDWGSVQPARVNPKKPAQILRDYCLSALVLAAEFRFKPVPGPRYYLYSTDQAWRLSLVGPEEWGTSIPGEFVAACRLRTDMTWALEFHRLADDSAVLKRLQRFVDGFSQTLSSQTSLTDELPFYVAEMPYFQRMLATGLSVSLRQSMLQTDSARLTEALPELTLSPP